VTDEFAAPPSPDGTPSGAARRADFRQVPPPTRRRRFPRWLTALIVAGGVVIAGGVVTQLALTNRAERLTPAEPGSTGRLHSAQVVSGMCLQSLGDSAGIVRVVSCDDPHAAEVVTSTELRGGDFPGATEVADTTLRYCASQLAPGGPLAAAAEGREWVAWVPSDATWEAGDRSGLCIVTAGTPWEGRAAG
jgi:hypothetical protein